MTAGPRQPTWDARLRTADEMIARAEADNRGVAMLPLSETARDISLQIAGAARVQIKQIKPKPHSVDRTEALPLIERFLEERAECRTGLAFGWRRSRQGRDFRRAA